MSPLIENLLKVEAADHRKIQEEIQKGLEKETEEVGFLQRIKNWPLGLWKKIFK